ncbi:hypothetical protein GGS24DRAFT_502264 [Hypoxylon argillaceum]|nr:hypothetical protein GGS24DRAFT_502264 [Hypoxylon argillaceum]KAI1152108.1 hypothetical protein F4825DRAFT_450797 [Nemania diffusa]
MKEMLILYYRTLAAASDIPTSPPDNSKWDNTDTGSDPDNTSPRSSLTAEAPAPVTSRPTTRPRPQKRTPSSSIRIVVPRPCAATSAGRGNQIATYMNINGGLYVRALKMGNSSVVVGRKDEMLLLILHLKGDDIYYDYILYLLIAGPGVRNH